MQQGGYFSLRPSASSAVHLFASKPQRTRRNAEKITPDNGIIMNSIFLRHRFVLLFLFIFIGAVIALPSSAQDVSSAVKSAEAQRVAVIEKARPSVVAIFGPGGQGGGS